MDTDEELTVWCGNLPNQTDEELLYELFLQVAPLKKVRIPTDKSGKYMNYGFVTFKHQISVQYAIDMFNGTQLYDRSIIVRSRNASKNQAQLPPAIIPNGLLMGIGLNGMGMPPLQMLQLPSLLSMIPPPQHDFHGKDRGRHGHHNDKPYRHHNNQRNNRNHYNDRNRHSRH